MTSASGFLWQSQSHIVTPSSRLSTLSMPMPGHLSWPPRAVQMFAECHRKHTRRQQSPTTKLQSLTKMPPPDTSRAITTLRKNIRKRRTTSPNRHTSTQPMLISKAQRTNSRGAEVRWHLLRGVPPRPCSSAHKMIEPCFCPLLVVTADDALKSLALHNSLSEESR